MPALEIPSELQSFAGLLNETLRRFKQYRSESEWVSTLLDGAASFADVAVLFGIEGDRLCLRGARGIELPEGLAFAMSLGRALDAAVETKDTVVALRTPGEVTSHLSSTNVSDRALLLPVLNGTRVVAVLFASGAIAGQSPALELLAGMASVVLERSANSSAHVQIAPAAATVPPRYPAPKLPYWSTLAEEQRRLHLRAQRFARVKTAEMQLFQPDACRAGREQNNIYLFLKKEIDAARESYRDQFLSRPGMEDYLHLELVNTVAGGDENKLGVDYPGHLG
jgi:hypothetical protein